MNCGGQGVGFLYEVMECWDAEVASVLLVIRFNGGEALIVDGK